MSETIFLPQEVIRTKREGDVIADSDIQQFVAGITDGNVTDAQVSALAMAIFFQGMSPEEGAALTLAMRDSGDVIDWSNYGFDAGAPITDKHSTGGVGDKVSLMLAPIVAACGGLVPMISGRGLGHTGGTLDKLDSIPGYRSQPDTQTIQSVVQSVGCAIVGQTAELAPADKRFYSIRDVTATVESVPLITASILSKKLSAGLDGLVMDIKTGNGAFAASREMASELAESIVKVGQGLGLPVTALITDMSQVLGRTAGNALEVIETLDYLKGDFKEPRLHENVIQLGAELLVSSKLAGNLDEGLGKMQESLDSGRALEYFARMVSALDGPSDFVEKPESYLEQAPIVVPVPAPSSATITEIDTRAVGNAVVELGGGRRLATDKIDFAVGLSEVRGLGEGVDADTPLAVVHARTEDQASAAVAKVQSAFSFGDPSTLTVDNIILERVNRA